MYRACLLLTLASCVSAQAPADLFHKAPPAVDEALRARITKFFQLHVDAKFRQAESLVAEDSKDFFYSANKPKYMGFEIKDIVYNDDFTKAKAVVIAQMVIMAPGFADKPVGVPIPSRWKIEKSEWCWYIDEDELNQTPFGKMHGGTAKPGALGTLPAMPSPEEAARMLAAGVKADHEELELKAKEPGSVEFTIANAMPGHVTLALDQLEFPGISVKLDSTDLASGEKAHVTVDWKPGLYRPRAIEARVRVQPTNQLLRLKVKFTD
jgi:hypothetical protein